MIRLPWPPWADRPGDSGMSTAEYAIGTVAAVAFAGLLLQVLTSTSVSEAVTELIMKALAP